MASTAFSRLISSPKGSSLRINTLVTPPNCFQSLGVSSSTEQLCPVPIAIPNKHIPVCPTGPAIVEDLETPPPSPKQTGVLLQSSLLYPPDRYVRVNDGDVSIYEIDAVDVTKALDFASRQPLPPPSSVFPWFHGLHPHNHMQQTFFNGRRRTPDKTPSCLRAVTIVKADGNLNIARLKGAIAPEEFMQPGPNSDFIEPNPPDGFSVRNFHIQPAKVAVTSDIIVYGVNPDEACNVAWDIAAAQKRWRDKQHSQANYMPVYNTFVCTSSFATFEDNHSNLVSINLSGISTGQILDFVHQERREMWSMTKASEIYHNVYLGPSPEPGGVDEQRFDVLIECSDSGQLNPGALQLIAEHPDQASQPSYHAFPSSGSILPPTWSHAALDGILDTCKWIYHISHGASYGSCVADTGTDDESRSVDIYGPLIGTDSRKILIHCPDGYTESTLLAIAYFSYSTGMPVPDAWLRLHTVQHRNFFAYPSDVSLLSALAPRLLLESPSYTGKGGEDNANLTKNEPSWFTGLDGSFPSRILDYLYLGNLGHANNPDLLRELNIRQILSVGESASWTEGDLKKWSPDNVCVIQGVQDNGIDPLTEEFARCFEFIDRGRQRGTATLVHCRVGVSRSATICIAEVMRTLELSFPRAYCFVRARRLNVIIQPHLRFVYELLRWEELLQQQRDSNGLIKREMEWGDIAREIAHMNRPYSK